MSVITDSSSNAGTQIVDFRGAIDRLNKRAAGARRKQGVVAGILLLSGIVVASVSFSEAYRFSRQNVAPAVLQSMIEAVAQTPEAELTRKIQRLIEEQVGGAAIDSKFQRPSKQEYADIDRNIDEAVAQYDRLEKTLTEREIKKSENTKIEQWHAVVTTSFINLGAVTFAILVIQIAFNFMRYYARLAELYDAQADALLASQGDADKAYKLLQQFSPIVIDFGKTPITVYEKALDVAASALKKK